MEKGEGLGEAAGDEREPYPGVTCHAKCRSAAVEAVCFFDKGGEPQLAA